MRSVLIISIIICRCLATAFSQQPAPEIITIPVVVHVVYNRPEQNISNGQIQSQIDVLNADYRKKNTDSKYIPQAFAPMAADARIEFRLATVDPLGSPTTGIVRKSTDIVSFAADDNIKSSLKGGDDGWNRNQYLNLWVCNLTGGILGYASTPGCVPEKDGVVIRFNAFGTTANVPPPFNKGRTATHEIGHWFGLRHIWGDSPCGDDRIDDTPPQSGPTRGCPSGVMTSCSAGAAGNMYMNFMDFTDDACTSMFTNGQVAKMHELFAQDGSRYALLSSTKAAGANAVVATSADGDMAVYPNPVVSELRITLHSIPEGSNGQLQMFDRTGRMVRKMSVNRRELVVDCSNLPAGLYFISYAGKTRKFVKAN